MNVEDLVKTKEKTNQKRDQEGRNTISALPSSLIRKKKRSEF